ncbi:hypothetical protein FQR65_LT20803 [Abscondita terminalis]|nr:hypothetical protein FQR65_LT20803 [Abscondita terminalis]
MAKIASLPTHVSHHPWPLPPLNRLCGARQCPINAPLHTKPLLRRAAAIESPMEIPVRTRRANAGRYRPVCNAKPAHGLGPPRRNRADPCQRPALGEPDKRTITKPGFSGMQRIWLRPAVRFSTAPPSGCLRLKGNGLLLAGLYEPPQRGALVQLGILRSGSPAHRENSTLITSAPNSGANARGEGARRSGCRVHHFQTPSGWGWGGMGCPR